MICVETPQKSDVVEMIYLIEQRILYAQECRKMNKEIEIPVAVEEGVSVK